MRSTTHDDNARSWRDLVDQLTPEQVSLINGEAGEGYAEDRLPHELFAGARYGRLAPALKVEDPDEPWIYWQRLAERRVEWVDFGTPRRRRPGRLFTILLL